MIVPDEISYSEVCRTIEYALANSDDSFVRARVDAQVERCPLIAHFYRNWLELQAMVQRSYTDREDRKLTKHFLALQRVEGALAMLLAILELNPIQDDPDDKSRRGSENPEDV